jgi:hypothetical protein
MASFRRSFGWTGYARSRGPPAGTLSERTRCRDAAPRGPSSIGPRVPDAEPVERGSRSPVPSPDVRVSVHCAGARPALQRALAGAPGDQGADRSLCSSPRNSERRCHSVCGLVTVPVRSPSTIRASSSGAVGTFDVRAMADGRPAKDDCIPRPRRISTTLERSRPSRRSGTTGTATRSQEPACAKSTGAAMSLEST